MALVPLLILAALAFMAHRTFRVQRPTGTSETLGAGEMGTEQPITRKDVD